MAAGQVRLALSGSPVHKAVPCDLNINLLCAIKSQSLHGEMWRLLYNCFFENYGLWKRVCKWFGVSTHMIFSRKGYMLITKGYTYGNVVQ